MATIKQAIQNAQNNPDPKKRSLPIPPTNEPPQSRSVSDRQNEPPRCPNCNGERFFRYDVPVGHFLFGKLFPCPTCNGDALTYQVGLNPMERLVAFGDIVTKNRPGAAAMLNAAQEFIADGCKGFLTFHGDYGNGKSTIAKALVNDCISKGLEVRYITMTEIMVYAREAFESEQNGDTDYGRIARLAMTQVLVIDEMEKARLTDYAREVQTHLFDVRYRQAYVLGTVVIWNGAFRDIPLPWVLSRLSEYPVIQNNDKDMRPLLRRQS